MIRRRHQTQTYLGYASNVSTLSNNLTNSPDKVAGGSLVQVELNFAAVVETLVSSGPQVKYVSRNGKPTEQPSKSKSLHCHIRPSTVPKEITVLHDLNTFLSPGSGFTDQTFSLRHWTRSNGVIRGQKGNGTIVRLSSA
ncbi:hypothetical protein QLX08_001349 [Tetragonisca angustula]|uniref:Uncharacterized protein n=1 Tax=Tetragonisca angustula TaxID=166442 RepID=A0AAW1AFN9_9HYME